MILNSIEQREIQNVLFSIIIPAFNSSDRICNCIKSILNQSFLEFEIVVVDGKSTDDTVQKVKSYDDDRINVYSEKDLGVYDAMNKGIKLAKGQWLYFLGSDDQFYDNDVLSDVAGLILNNQKINVLYGNVQIIGELPFWANGVSIYGGEFDIKRLKQQNICHQAIFYRNSFLLENNFRYSLKFPVCADWDMNLKCWIQSPFYYFDRTICFFASGGISSQNTDDFHFQINSMILKYERKYISFYINYVKCFLKSIKTIVRRKVIKFLFLNK
jgi:glycosyltransferase involved in cell wall biosynthesis